MFSATVIPTTHHPSRVNHATETKNRPSNDKNDVWRLAIHQPLYG